MTERHHVTVSEEHHKSRLDHMLVSALPSLSRTRIQNLIREGRVTKEHTPITACHYRVTVGDAFVVSIPPVKPLEHPDPEPIALHVVYEDDDLIVIDKPAGLVVHPGAGNIRGTLVNALLAHCGDSLSGISGVQRPGIVHRLDKDTSGLLVAAKHDACHRALSLQFENRALSRTYTAFVWGVPNPPSGRIETQIGRDPRSRQRMTVLSNGGRTAITHYSLEKTAHGISLISCRLETGRTHQIRVHCLHAKLPILGDPVYGYGPVKLLSGLSLPNRQALHAKRIQFVHPIRGVQLCFESELPADLMELYAFLFGNLEKQTRS